jgi:phosphate starvation-inducible protein PhoH and related proteins
MHSGILMDIPFLEVIFDPLDNERLLRVCGILDENLRRMEAVFDVRIVHRAGCFRIYGESVFAQKTAQALHHLYAQIPDAVSQWDGIELDLLEVDRQPMQSVDVVLNSVSDALPEGLELRTRKAHLHGRTPRQVHYIKNILQHELSFGIGPAGSGKTYLAVACAVDAFEREQVDRIVLTRPAVEAGERLGFLPGDLSQKVDPYLRPLYDALHELMGLERTAKLFERGQIEIAPLAFMRGRTLNKAFIILDEAQNTTPEQMKMFLTRFGFGSKAVITGDVTQIDLPKGQTSGLVHACDVLKSVKGIAFSYFQTEDVVRHRLVARIVQAYAEADTKKRIQAAGGGLHP